MTHPHTEQCGFDRNSSHTEKRYVCMCGWSEPRGWPERFWLIERGSPAVFWDGFDSWVPYEQAFRYRAETAAKNEPVCRRPGSEDVRVAEHVETRSERGGFPDRIAALHTASTKSGAGQ